MRILRSIAILLLIALIGWLTIFTCSKLYKMSAIRGWVPGAIYKEHIVTDKRVLDGKYGPAYWVAWEGADITRRSTRRTNLGKEQWQTIDIGDRVTIAYYRGNPKPYIPDGIFVSPENFAFDLILFTGEIWIIAILARLLLKWWSKNAADPSA